IVSSAGTDSDFPASNLLDPDPRRVWRAGTLGWTPGAASSDVNFTLDLGSNSAESIDTFALLFGHFVGGTNVFSPDGDGLRIRIRVGPANGTWTTYDSSFQAGFDLIHHNPWPFYASALSGSYPLNDYRNS